VGPRKGRDRIQARSAQLTVVDALELGDDGPRLVAGRCGGCAALTFPLRARCPSCGGGLARELLPRRGTLWTWTTQGFEPKSPPYLADDGAFEPFAVGYVEFAGALRVEGRLADAGPERLRIGMELEVVALERGGRVTYAFAVPA
jgi:uncharacterized OB-fold protein